MRIIRTSDYGQMSRRAAWVIAAQVLQKPDCVLGLATGGTPEGTYRQLVEWYQRGDLDFSQVTTINLDEYRGLPREHEQSYWSFMHRHFFDLVNVPPQHIHLPDGTQPDSAAACSQYDGIIRAAGGIDLQLLGLGYDGHIGFNEPGEAFVPDTHCVDLTESTIEANKRFFERKEDVPRQAYTMGIRAIMQARRVLLIVSGEGKAEIVRRSFLGPITPEVPASILQLHPDFILIGDEAALSLIDAGAE